MDKYFIYKDGVENLSEILTIYYRNPQSSTEYPYTLNYKNGKSVNITADFAGKIISALKQAIKEDTNNVGHITNYVGTEVKDEIQNS